jgi:POT family proton-dependent oligopeptide transporter
VGREFSSTETEVPATWFGILNSLFIVVFAPFSRSGWESKYNPPGPLKFGLGLSLLGLGLWFWLMAVWH